MTANLHPIQNYGILGLVGVGGTSFVFAAVHREMWERFGLDRKVALKFLWDLDRAKDEVLRLGKLDHNKGANNLFDYFEIKYRHIHDLIDPHLDRNQSLANKQLHFEEDHVFGVLVLQFAHGQSIVTTTAMLEENEHVPHRDWVIEIEGKPFRQSLSLNLDFEERQRFILSLIGILKTAHAQEPTEVHGDLHPGNLVFDRDRQELEIIDWSSMDIYGIEGWISPWHDAYVLEEIDSLPPEADVYVLALWIDRLLGSDSRPLRQLARNIIRLGDQGKAEQMPTVATVHEKVQKILRERLKARQKRLIGSIVLLTCLVWGGLFWFFFMDRESSLDREKIVALTERAIENPDLTSDILERLNQELREATNQRKRDLIIASIARIHRIDFDQNRLFFQSFDLSRPSAIMVSAQYSFLLYEQWCFSLGTPVNDDEYIYQISHDRLTLFNEKTQATRSVRFERHPIDQANAVEDVFIIYESQLRDILSALIIMCDMELETPIDGNTKIRGSLRGQGPKEILKDIFHAMEVPFVDSFTQSIPEIEKNTVRCWEIPKGRRVRGDFTSLIYDLFIQPLGYEVTDIPEVFYEMKVSTSVEETTHCLPFFNGLLKEHGYTITESEDGDQLMIEALPGE